MENGTYRECFQRLRLRANITTLAELGDLLAYKSYDYEGSFLSRWQSGKKIPKNRGLHLALLEVFAERDKTLTLSECNRLFELAGLGNLTLDESEQLHLSENQSQLFPSPELWTVPYQRNPYFTGRDEVFAQLEHHFSPLGQTTGQETRRLALTQPHAIKGLGGIGKTQIAVEFAYRSRASGRFKHTFWVNAANEETILASFVELAGILPELSATNVTDQRKLVEAVKRWLEDRQQSWLLIFDNVDNIDNLPALREYLPQRGNGSVLLTTRANAVGSLATSIEVDTMGWREGTDLLLRRAGRFKDLSEEINETYLEEINRAGDIVMALDYFPLALDQAGAYIEETQCTFEDYLALYQTHRQKLLARRGKQATNYPDSVATTWSLSFQKVEQANPAAAQLLHLCAFLAPDRIPEELIKEGAAYWPLELKQSAADFYTYNEVIEELLKFSLVKRQVEDRVLSIHRLVQAVQVDIMEPEVRLQWAERVVRGIDAGFPVNSDELAAWPSCLRYLDQAQTCHTLIEHYEFSFPEAANVLNRIGLYLHDHALYTLSEPLYQRALAIREQLLGEMHPDTATSLNNLAVLYDSLGKYAEAEPLYQRALAIREQLLGEMHPHTANTLDNLAILYANLGKYAKAEPLFQRALTIREQLLGEMHSDTALSLNNLAELYRLQGKLADAEPLALRALTIQEQQLGEMHPYTANALDNLAELYRLQGKLADAEPLALRALTIREQQLGGMHPETAASLNNLASLYESQGRHAEAEPLYRRALAIYEQQLGDKHPTTSVMRDKYAVLLEAMKQDEEVE